MKKLPILIIISSVLGIILNLIQINFFDEGINRLYETLSLFKYFTIQSNILVAVYFILLLSGKYKDSKLFKDLFGTVFISISVTGFVFATYLEWTYVSHGLYKWSSFFNHYVSPILVIVYLIKNRLNFNFEKKNIKLWLIFPVTYLVFLLVFGAITNDFIYPFFQIDEIGVLWFIIDIIVLILFFFGLSFLLVKIFSFEEKT